MNQTNPQENKNPLLISHTQLWVGQHEAVVTRVTQLLQKTFCQNGGCNTCTPCMQVRDHQHHAIMWMEPEKTYTKDQFNDLFATLSFSLDQDKHYFFIIQKADFLPPAPANRLLKSLEEPPPGYHFILIAERADQLLPTIKSRCVIHEHTSNEQLCNHPLFSFFTAEALFDPIQFLKTLDTSKINERESIELVDALLKYWIGYYKKNMNNSGKIIQKIAALKQIAQKPPMPGSSKVFWKDAYLQFQ